VRNPKAYISKGATVQTPPGCLEPCQQPFTVPHEGRTLEAPRILKPKVSSGLLQVSPSYPRGGLWRRHEFIMPHPVCNYVYRIVLQFYVCFFAYLNPHVVNYFFSVPLLIRVVQSYHRQVCLRYLRPTWGPLVIFLLGVCVVEWLPLRKANANRGSRVCSILSLVLYPKRVHYAFLTLPAKYWGPRWCTTLRRSITIT
jgi:hypothetical protein